MQQSVKLLGHVVDRSGVHVYLDKIEAIKNFSRPRDVTELRSFLGTAGYYRKFIKGFANLSAVLYASTSVKKKGLVWTEVHEEAFVALKEKLTSPPVLAYPRFYAPLVVDTYASSVAVGAVIAQKQADDKIHPVYDASWTINWAEKNY